MILVDMHVHSTCSDGIYTVEELAGRGKRLGLSLLSLTDHDTTEGLDRFAAACVRCGVPSLAGIELSADADYTLHILGYRIDPHEAYMAETLMRLREQRGVRNAVICERLRGLGFDITIGEVEAEANGDVVARPHIAAVMRRKGYVSSVHEAFNKYFGRGGPAYAPRARLSAEECISMITRAGGVAVLAHPFQTNLGEDGLSDLVGRLKEAGLWGIETVYTGHSPEQIFQLLCLAGKYSLYTTAGSDFHGYGHSVGLGMRVSEDFLSWARLGVR